MDEGEGTTPTLAGDTAGMGLHLSKSKGAAGAVASLLLLEGRAFGGI
jgi:hypothetical protein